MKNACKNCSHWRPSSPTSTSAPCRVDGPVAQTDQNVNQPRGAWPFTEADEDCGLFDSADMGVTPGKLEGILARLVSVERGMQEFDKLGEEQAHEINACKGQIASFVNSTTQPPLAGSIRTDLVSVETFATVAERVQALETGQNKLASDIAKLALQNPPVTVLRAAS